MYRCDRLATMTLIFWLSILYSLKKLYWRSNMVMPQLILIRWLSGKGSSEILLMALRWLLISSFVQVRPNGVVGVA